MARDALLITALRVFGVGAWFLYSVMIARVLGAESFGFVQFHLNFYIFAAFCLTAGYETVIVRYVSVYRARSDVTAVAALVARARFVVFINALLLAAVLVVLALAQVDAPVTAEWWLAIVTATGAFASGLMSLHRDTLRAHGRVGQAMLGQSIIRSVFPLALSALMLAFATLDKVGAVLIFLAGLLFSIAIELVLIRRLALPSPPAQPGEDVKEWRTAARTFFIGDLGHNVLCRVAALVLGIAFDLRLAALYFAADRIATMSQFVGESVQLAGASEIAVAHRNADPAILQDALAKASALSLLSGLPVSLGLIIVGPLIVGQFGAEFTDAYPLLVALIVGQSALAIFGPTPMFCNMIGMGGQRATATWASVLVQSAFVAWGIVTKSMIFAAVGVAISLWLLHLVLAIAIYRKTGMRTGIFALSIGGLSAMITSFYRTALRQR